MRISELSHKVLDYVFLLASVSLTFCPTLHFHSTDSTKNRIRFKLGITMVVLRNQVSYRLWD